MDCKGSRHTWTLLDYKHLIQIALKYRLLYKLTSSDMIKAIINDPEFKIKGVDRESQLLPQLGKISSAAKKNSYNNEQKYLKKLNNDFYGITSPMDLDELIDLKPNTNVGLQYENLKPNTNEDIDLITKRIKKEK